MKQYNAGVNFWLHPDVVFKADVQLQDNNGTDNDNGYNLALATSFELYPNQPLGHNTGRRCAPSLSI